MAKRIVDEEMRFKIIINGNEAQKELHDLEKSTRKLTTENKDLRAEKKKLRLEGKQGTDQYKKLTAEISKNNSTIRENKTRMQSLQKQIGITGLTMAQLKKRANELRLQLLHMVPGSAQHKKYTAELKAINTRLSQLRREANAAKTAMGRLSQKFNEYAIMGAAIIVFLHNLIYQIQRLIDYNGELSDAQSDVMKTTKLTRREIDELTKSFGILKTRTARIELLKLAEEAGRLGIEGTQNIKDFVEVANQLKVALSDDLSETQIREVGKMVKIYGVGEKSGRNFKESLLSLGSALNEVSANGANTASFLVDYLKRQAGVAAQARLSAEDNIGYAATFDELGQSVEVSATAMNKVWIDMFKDSQTYADIAGMQLEEFSTLLQTDANEAMIAFLKGLNGNNEGLTVMVRKLKELDAGGARGVQVLTALAGNTDLLQDRQKLANKAIEEATSLTDEYNIKNNNLAATIEKIKNRSLELVSSKGLVKFLEITSLGFAKLIGAVGDSTEALEKERLEVLKLESKIKDVNIKQEDRIKLIEEFQKQYPGYLQNLDAEKVSNEQLTTAISEVNEQLINKIILQKEDEKITENIQNRAEIKIRFLEQEDEVRGRMVQLAKKYNLTLKEGVGLQEQASDIVKKIGITGGIAIDPVAQLSHQLFKLSEIEKHLNAEVDRGNILSNKRTELAARLNITLKSAAASAGPQEGDQQTIGGLLFVYRSGKWVLVVPEVTPETKKEIITLVKEIETVVNGVSGEDIGMDFSLLTPIQRTALERDSDFLIKRIGEIILVKNGLTGELEEVDLGAAGQMDVLGFTADQWLNTFTNLDTLQGKLAAAEMVVGGLLSMWNIYQQFVEANEAKSMALFEARTQKKKDRLKDQLDNGVINRKTYTKSVQKLDKDHDKIQRELEYQQAERAHKRMLINSIGQAAMAVLSGLTSTPFMPVGIAMGALAAILGGIQVGIVAKNKPVKGLESGYYPVEREQDGRMFNAQYGGQTTSGMVNTPTVFMAGENNRPEMVIDNNAYKQMNPGFRDALHREIARVKGFENGYYPDPKYTQNDTSVNDAFLVALNRNSAIMERIEESGIIAIVSSKDYNNMKEIKEGLDNYNELRNKNKI